jgi:FixJ family two-component response regulator
MNDDANFGTTTTLFIIDADADARQALGHQLRAGGFAVEAHATGGTFLGSCRRGARGCVLADLALPDMPFPELTQRMAAAGIGLPVIATSSSGQVKTAVRAMQCGAADFLQKPVAADDLWESVHRAMELEAQWRPARARREEVLSRIELLTAEEKCVLAMLLEGRPNKSIASRMSLSQRTIDFRRASVMRKLGARSLAELVQMVTAARLETPEPLRWGRIGSMETVNGYP